MKLLLSKIADLQTKLDPIKDKPQALNFNADIKRKLEKIDRDAEKKKIKKYHRDMCNFRKNSIYLWQLNASDTKEVDEKFHFAPPPPSKISSFCRR